MKIRNFFKKKKNCTDPNLLNDTCIYVCICLEMSDGKENLQV